MRNCPFNPLSLVKNSYRVDGFKEFITANWYENNPSKILPDAMLVAMEEVEDEYSDWDVNQGFGSSDGTYATQSYIDNMIDIGGFYGKYKTDFTPSLTVVKI